MHPTTITKRSLQLSALAAAIMAVTSHAQINDSIRGAPSEANHFIETPQGWQHPTTEWGEPDLRAMLNMMQAAGVPLERCANSYRPGAPACDMDKAWLTEEEYQQRLDQAAGRIDRSRQALEEGDLATSIRAGLTDPNIPQRQTNLIVDPPDGRLPPLTAEGKRRALEMRSGWSLPGEDHTYDWATDFDSWDRCITRGMPSMMMPYRYNGGFAIRQAPGYVILDIEMIHESRIIPTDGREALPSEIKQYLGDSRGRWEGNTLVVETTNYKVGAPLINLAVVGSPPGNRFPMSEQMKTIERITRINDEWWLYEITTEDPLILEGPFTVRYPMHHDPNYWWPEYACHEDNTIVPYYTETNRHERENPKPVVPEPVEVSPSLADALAGRWVGSPEIYVIDLEMELEFEKNADGTVVGSLVGTKLGRIDRPLRNVRVDGRRMNFELPNWQPWNFAGEVTEEGTIEGFVMSAQGGFPVTLERVSQ
jgi:hypothetical protein